MRLSEFDYALPPALIAQHPLTPRDAARLLVGTGRPERSSTGSFGISRSTCASATSSC